MLHPHEIKATKLRATFNKLIKKYPEPSSSEHIDLVKLINELSVLGFPMFVKAVEGVLNTKGVQKFISPALRAVLKRACSEVQSKGPDIELVYGDQVYGIAEEEHLLRQLKELIEETKLLHAFKDLSDIERLRSSLWIVATPWVLKKAHDERNQRLRRLLINASVQMGASLSANAERYEDECFDILSDVVRDCYLAGGELDLGDLYALSDQTIYLLDDLRGLGRVSLLSRDLSYLLKNQIRGLDYVQSIGINELRGEHLDLLIESSDQEYVQGIVNSLVKGAETKAEHGLEYPPEILDKINDSQYKDELLFVAKRVSYQMNYELDKVSFNLNYIPHPDQAYWMMETQVTQALYRAVIGKNPSRFEGDQLPVECVSWEDGIAFCNALSKKLGLTPAYKGTDNHCELVSGANGFRLPFEAEWEFAAKGGQNFEYAGSDNLNEVGWYGGMFDGGNVTNNQTQPVAQLKPNGYGLYDMSGNVWEWCADDYNNSGQHRLGASERAFRGGCWLFLADYCEVSGRFGGLPDNRGNYLGLRLSRPLG